MHEEALGIFWIHIRGQEHVMLFFSFHFSNKFTAVSASVPYITTLSVVVVSTRIVEKRNFDSTMKLSVAGLMMALVVNGADAFLSRPAVSQNSLVDVARNMKKEEEKFTWGESFHGNAMVLHTAAARHHGK